MKKLFLKNGIHFDVILKASLGSNGKEQRNILFHDTEGFMIADIKEGGFNNAYVTLTGKKLDFYEVSAIAEIIENFNQYFNNLNQ